jgi:hypothetical protein
MKRGDVTMPKKFHDVRNSKKMLMYGSSNSIGPFRQKSKKKIYATEKDKPDIAKDLNEVK